jgi:hypothetical protein
MTRSVCTGRRAALASLALFVPMIAGAQSIDQASAAAQVSQGPMVFERVQSGFLVAPEFKVTDFDNKTSGLAGFYSGWLHDQTFFIGGGAYFLTDWSSSHELGYGGLVVGWSLFPEERVGVSVKGLIGGGIATQAATISFLPPIYAARPYPLHGGGFYPGLPTVPVTANVILHTDIFVAEPEATVSVKLQRNIRLTGSVGYRLTAGGGDLPNSVGGVTGSVALQIGGGS